MRAESSDPHLVVVVVVVGAVGLGAAAGEG